MNLCANLLAINQILDILCIFKALLRQFLVQFFTLILGIHLVLIFQGKVCAGANIYIFFACQAYVSSCNWISVQEKDICKCILLQKSY